MGSEKGKLDQRINNCTRTLETAHETKVTGSAKWGTRKSKKNNYIDFILTEN